MTVDEIVKIIYPNNSEDFFLGSSVIKVNRPKESFFIPDFNEIADKFLESHLTKQFFYCDYLNQCEEKKLKSISRSDFYAKLRIAVESKVGPKVYMSQTHIYGNELCIDFAGDNIEYFENGVKKERRCLCTYMECKLLYFCHYNSIPINRAYLPCYR